ncbi:glycosyl transferase [Bacteroidia bacterium]|nr:glycosyl transferase [Bacteroidia bacterium]
MKKKRILFLMDTMDGGGAEKVLLQILQNIDYAKFDVDLCLIYHKGVYLDDIPSQVSTSFLSKIKPGIFFRLIRFAQFLHIEKLLEIYINSRLRSDYDVEIAFLEGQSTKFIAMRRSKALKFSWVHSDLHACHWTKDEYRNLESEREAFRAMDHIVFVCRQNQLAFNQLFRGMDTSTQRVLYNPINRNAIVNLSKAFPVEKKVFTICSLGRFIQEKGFDRLIRVCGRLRDDGFSFQLWLIGKALDEKDWKELVASLHLESVVDLIGFVNNPYPYLNAADLYVSSSRAEGFSLVIAEALCLGKPVVSTTTAGAKDLLNDGEYGLLTENSEQGLYEGIKAMMTSEETMNIYREKAQMGAKQFDFERTMNAIIQTITSPNL